MSDLTNKASYLKGLAEGLKLDPEKKEDKLIGEIISFLGDIAEKIELVDDEQGFITDQIDDIEEAIDIICEDLYDDEYDEDEDLYVTCEACGEDIFITNEDIMDGSILCPSCGHEIEFEIDCDCNCEECDCE